MASTNELTLAIKIGGNVITAPGKPFVINRLALSRIAKVISEIENRVVVVHGLGSFGRAVLPLYENNSISADNFALARHVQGSFRRLHEELLVELSTFGLPVRGFDPEALFCPHANGSFESFLDPVFASLSRGELPVLYGGTIRNGQRNFSILSSDQILGNVIQSANGEKCALWVCNVNGVLGKEPTRPTIPRLTPASIARVWNPMEQLKDPTGAMKNKILVSVRLAELGINSVLFHHQDFASVIATLGSQVATGRGSGRWTLVQSDDWVSKQS